MFGVIFDDIIGSCFEHHNCKSNYEDAIRDAISIGGDSDTIAAIAGGIAEAYYGEIPGYISGKCRLLLDSGIKKTVNEFYKRYKI